MRQTAAPVLHLNPTMPSCVNKWCTMNLTRPIIVNITVALVVLILSGCGVRHSKIPHVPYVPYEPFNIWSLHGTGFVDLRLDERTFIVEYRINPAFPATDDQLEQFLFRRCAELVQSIGFHYFVVLDGISYAEGTGVYEIEERLPGIDWILRREVRSTNRSLSGYSGRHTLHFRTIRVTVRAVPQPTTDGARGITHENIDLALPNPFRR